MAREATGDRAQGAAGVRLQPAQAARGGADRRRAVEDFPTRPLFRCLLAQLAAEAGDEREARTLIDNLAGDDFEALPLDNEWLFSVSALCEVCGVLGDAAAAETLYAQLAPYAGYNVYNYPEVSVGSASRLLGILATVLGRWEEAADHYEAAVEMNARMGALSWLAHTQHDFARMLLDRGGPGDRERSRTLLEAARMTYRELGMDTFAAAASALSTR